jgi:hypothetical protein
LKKEINFVLFSDVNVSAAKIVNYHLGRKRFIKKRIPSHSESISDGKFVALLYSQYKTITHKMGKNTFI